MLILAVYIWPAYSPPWMSLQSPHTRATAGLPPILPSTMAPPRTAAPSTLSIYPHANGWPGFYLRPSTFDLSIPSPLVEDVAMVVDEQRGDDGRHDCEGDGQDERQQVRSDGDGERVDGALAANEWSRRRGEASCFELHNL